MKVAILAQAGLLNTPEGAYLLETRFLTEYHHPQKSGEPES